MKINLGFIFDLFRGVKQVKKEVTEVRCEAQTQKKEKEDRHALRLAWMKGVTIDEIVENVKTTIKECGLYEKYGEKLNMGEDELSLEISLGLDEESYTKIDIKNAFDSGIACTTGVVVDQTMLSEFAEYYYANFYSEEKQREYHREGKIKREAYEK